MDASGGPSNTVLSPEGSWGFRVRDAGNPPSMLTTSLWLFLSLNVAVLFLEVRPAAIRRVRAAAETPLHAVPDEVRRAGRARRLWHLVVAVWSLALYEVVHRTCSYCVLSPHMLVRRRLLPLGSTFLWDGLWTAWVNWARFYLFCTSAVSLAPGHASAAPAPTRASCADFELPLAGRLPLEQYPEYAALRPGEAASADEVTAFRQVGVASLVITWVAVIAVHAQFGAVRRVFFSNRGNSETEYSVVAKEADDEKKQVAAGTKQKSTGEHRPRMGATGAPGDDSWVDSPEALEEEERWRREGLLAAGDGGRATPDGALRSRAAESSTTRIFAQCWPSLLATTYAALFALMGGLPLFMQLLYPAATVIVSVMVMLAVA